MKIIVMNKDIPLLEIEKTKFDVKSVKLFKGNIKDYSIIVYAKCRKLFPENITLENLDSFLESRCIDKRRADLDIWLKLYDIPSYNPYWICRKTHGVIPSDFIWLKFDEEKLVFDNVKIRD